MVCSRCWGFGLFPIGKQKLSRHLFLQHSVFFRPVKKGAPSCGDHPLRSGAPRRPQARAKGGFVGNLAFVLFAACPKSTLLSRSLYQAPAKAFLVTFWAKKVAKPKLWNGFALQHFFFKTCYEFSSPKADRRNRPASFPKHSRPPSLADPLAKVGRSPH